MVLFLYITTSLFCCSMQFGGTENSLRAFFTYESYYFEKVLALAGTFFVGNDGVSVRFVWDKGKPPSGCILKAVFRSQLNIWNLRRFKRESGTVSSKIKIVIIDRSDHILRMHDNLLLPNLWYRKHSKCVADRYVLPVHCAWKPECAAYLPA